MAAANFALADPVLTALVSACTLPQMAESFTVESTDAASSAFTLNSGPYRNIPIYVHLAK